MACGSGGLSQVGVLVARTTGTVKESLDATIHETPPWMESGSEWPVEELGMPEI